MRGREGSRKIKWRRSIFTRHGKLARRFMAFLLFASTLIWIHQNVKGPSLRSN